MPLNAIDIPRLQHILHGDLNRWKTTPDELNLRSKHGATRRHMMRALPALLAEGEMKHHHLVLGPRQSGKSTMLWQTIKALKTQYLVPDGRIFYLEMDHPELVSETLGGVMEVLFELCPDASRSEPMFVFVDEICRSTDWGGWIKMFSDNGKPCRILATSSAFTWNTDTPDSLVGRLHQHTLMPCNFLEYLEFKGLAAAIPECFWVGYPSLKERLADIPANTILAPEAKYAMRQMLLFGAYPECASQFGSRNRDGEYIQTVQAHPYLRGIAQTVTSHDIPLLQEVRGRDNLRKLLQACARFMCTQTTTSKLGKQAGIKSANTTNDYLNLIVEAAFLVFRLKAHVDPSATNTAVPANQKILFVDTAMAAALRRSGTSSLDDANQKGWVYENAAGAALHELAVNAGRELAYWRAQPDYEVDFIYDGHGEDTIAVEVASSNSHSRRGLNKLLRDIPRLRDSVYLVYPDSPIIQPKHAPDHIGELPLDIFLLAVAAQSVQEMLAKGGLSSPANYRVKQPSTELMFRHGTQQPSFRDGRIVLLTDKEAQKAATSGVIDPRPMAPGRNNNNFE